MEGLALADPQRPWLGYGHEQSMGYDRPVFGVFCGWSGRIAMRGAEALRIRLGLSEADARDGSIALPIMRAASTRNHMHMCDEISVGDGWVRLRSP